MNYYRTCDHCGAHLDPGERCDCLDRKFAEVIQELTPEDQDHLLQVMTLMVREQKQDAPPAATSEASNSRDVAVPYITPPVYHDGHGTASEKTGGQL